MQDLSSTGHGIVEDLARKNDVGTDAVLTLLAALQRGGGSQAQFNHPDLGGMGQWSCGGMTMVGDMFNRELKVRVDRLCAELSGLIGNEAMFEPAAGTRGESQASGHDGAGTPGPASTASLAPASPQGRWPTALGSPSATGSQNDLHYAVFPGTRRLAIERDGKVTVYDTGDHRIGGASQQQSGDQSLSFTSQHGSVRLADLPVVEGDGTATPAHPAPEASEPTRPVPGSATSPPPAPTPAGTEGGDVFAKIEQLADLHRKGVLTDEEYNGKKAELLGRL